jgi:hypothetical protein
MDKSFLVLFFKREQLSFLEAPSQAAILTRLRRRIAEQCLAEFLIGWPVPN